MKYARVRNGKVVKIDRVEFPDSLPIVVKWEVPTEFPRSFYVFGDIVHTVLKSRVVEERSFILKHVDLIRDSIYDLQAEKRKEAQLGSFQVGKHRITLRKREDSLTISSMTAKQKNFKLRKGKWAKLDAKQVQEVKDAHEAHVQHAYDLEMKGNEEVSSITSYKELRRYYERKF